jgi:hypothetical protein
VPIDRSVVNREGNDRFKCPGAEGRGLAYPRAGLAADLFTRRSGYFNRRRPASVRLTECRPPEMMSQSLSIAPFRPLETSSGRPVDRRFGLDAVGLVAYPDSHAGVVEGLHTGVDLAVVELLQDAL